MVDEFITGGGASEANLVFTLKKSELEKIKGTFKPTSNEDFILFEFEAKGMITVSMNDNGVTAWAKISTTEIDLKGENYQSFNLVYSMYDRLIVGGVKPSNAPLKLETIPYLKSENFLDRRELGVVNVGEKGFVS